MSKMIKLMKAMYFSMRHGEWYIGRCSFYLAFRHGYFNGYFDGNYAALYAGWFTIQVVY
jgi:hypothetical protein